MNIIDLFPNWICKLVDNWRDIARAKDNVLRSEWLSMFPLLQSVEITTFGAPSWKQKHYKFRLEDMLETIQFISPSITITVRDYGAWLNDALIDSISEKFDAVGWNVEFNRCCGMVQSWC